MTKIFADGADLETILELAKDPRIEGFTTNPLLMRKAGIAHYREFARCILTEIKNRPVSFEVLSDDHDEMYRQAMEIASWGPNAVVKIPVYHTNGIFTGDLIAQLGIEGVTVNVTAVLDSQDVVRAALCMRHEGYISVFAGRIADTGIDPYPIMRDLAAYLREYHVGMVTKLIWASPREIFNYYQAKQAWVDIITMTPDLIAKLNLGHKDLREYSIETVQQFYKFGKQIAW